MTRSFLACQGTAYCSMVMNSPNLEKRGTKSPPTGRRSCLPLAPRKKNCHSPMPQEMCPVQPARRGNLPSPQASSLRVPTDSPSRKSYTTENAPLHLRRSVTSMKRTHTVCPPSARTSLTVTEVAKKVTSPHGNTPCICPNGHLPLKGQGRSPTLKSLPGLSVSTLRVTTEALPGA